ncbi:hypothetical protein ScPMuIL_015321 [Solemya velum]
MEATILRKSNCPKATYQFSKAILFLQFRLYLLTASEDKQQGVQRTRPRKKDNQLHRRHRSPQLRKNNKRQPLNPARQCLQQKIVLLETVLAINVLESAKCLWCGSKSLCVLYPAGDVLPKTSLCPLDEARWGVCWLNFEALIISMSVIGGALILALVICICCCCCCKGKKKSKYLAEEIKYEREKEERKRKSEERRSERKEKNDEIRRKYGLIKEDNPYQRFDNA